MRQFVRVGKTLGTPIWKLSYYLATAMTRALLVTTNLFRNGRRTLLTLASVGAFFVMFAILVAVSTFIASPFAGDPRAACVNLAQTLRFVG